MWCKNGAEDNNINHNRRVKVCHSVRIGKTYILENEDP